MKFLSDWLNHSSNRTAPTATEKCHVKATYVHDISYIPQRGGCLMGQEVNWRSYGVNLKFSAEYSMGSGNLVEAPVGVQSFLVIVGGQFPHSLM